MLSSTDQTTGAGGCLSSRIDSPSGEAVHGHSRIPKIVLGTMGASLECLECDDNSADSAAVYDNKNFCAVVLVYLGPVLSTVMTSSRTSKIIFLDDVIIGAS